MHSRHFLTNFDAVKLPTYLGNTGKLSINLRGEDPTAIAELVEDFIEDSITKAPHLVIEQYAVGNNGRQKGATLSVKDVTSVEFVWNRQSLAFKSSSSPETVRYLSLIKGSELEVCLADEAPFLSEEMQQTIIEAEKRAWINLQVLTEGYTVDTQSFLRSPQYTEEQLIKHGFMSDARECEIRCGDWQPTLSQHYTGVIQSLKVETDRFGRKYLCPISGNEHLDAMRQHPICLQKGWQQKPAFTFIRFLALKKPQFEEIFAEELRKICGSCD